MVKLVTVATHSAGYLPWLKKSCDRYNVKLEVLGWNQKWSGYNMKLLLMANYLKSQDPEELICFIDAYDVILLRSLNEIDEYYNNIVKLTGKKIIIATDHIHSKFIETMTTIIFDKCKNISINSGTYLGKSKDLLKILDDMNANNKASDDDQVIYTDYCNKHPDIFFIDHDKIFFLTIEDTFTDVLQHFDIKIENNNVKYQGSRPFFIHGNGNTVLDNLIEKLGYSITDTDKKEVNGGHTKIIINKVKYYTKHLFNTYYAYIILTCILVVLYYCYKKINNPLLKI